MTIPPAVGKPIRGGWAVTLKAAAQQGLPVSMDDPRYLDQWRYLSLLQTLKVVRTPYSEAVTARYVQEAGR